MLADGPPPSVTAAHNLLTDLTLGQMLALFATAAIVFGIVRKINPVMHRLNDMLDDWNGEKARPGVPERSGVMERLSEQDAVLATLRHRIEPLVDETAKGNHLEVLARLDAVAEHHADCDSRMERIEHLLNRHLREAAAWVHAVDRATAERGFETPPWPNLPDDEHGGNPT